METSTPFQMAFSTFSLDGITFCYQRLQAFLSPQGEIFGAYDPSVPQFAFQFCYTGMHQVLLSPGNSQWMASIGFSLRFLDPLTYWVAWLQKSHFAGKSGHQFERIGVGFALLALALIQFNLN
jgi:hypothetical protein